MSLDQLITATKTLLGESAVLTDPAQMTHYTTSMRNRHTMPAPMVALPQSTAQTAELVLLCKQHRVAIVPQGGNTGLVDGGLPTGQGDQIIVNLSRLNNIRDIDGIGLIATVEAGTILQHLQESAASRGLLFPLTIASEGSAEIGGLISTNAGGSAALRYGTMRNLVMGIEAVLPNGEIISDLKPLAKDNTGYHLPSYFVGAEGTLGIVTAATLRLLPALRRRLTAVAAVPDITAALDLLADFRREAMENLLVFEFMSRAALQLLINNIPAARFPSNNREAPYYLLIELGASSELTPLDTLFESVMTPALEKGRALDAIMATNETQAQQFWHAREHIPEALRNQTHQRVHFDISLPVKSLPDFLSGAETRIKAECPGVVLMPFGHIGDGNVHYNMYLPAPLDDLTFAVTKKALQEIVFEETHRRQGSISAEHGIGVERKEIMARLKSPTEIDAMRAIKRAFDPDHLMNPGKIFD